MTDDRPPPRYGQYAPVPPTTAPSETVPPGTASPAAATPATEAPAVRDEWQPPVVDTPAAKDVTPQRDTRDIVLTTFLLLIGVYDTVGSFGRFADLHSLVQSSFDYAGVGQFTSTALAASVGLIINIARVVLLIAAIGFALYRISRHRTAFWFPVVAGAIAWAITIGCVLFVMVSDPAFTAYVMAQSTRGS